MKKDEIIRNLEQILERNTTMFETAGSYFSINKDVEKLIRELIKMYRQEKEKNKEAIQKAFEDGQISIVNRYISKDKIRAKIKELENELEYENFRNGNLIQINVLKKLLEEE